MILISCEPKVEKEEPVSLKPLGEPSDSSPLGKSNDSHTAVQVFYATDRAQVETDDVKLLYSGDRGGMTYGTCSVSIPEKHRIGELEEPSWWKFEFRENPDKHVVLMSVEQKSRGEYFGSMRAFLDTCNSEEAFVFVHGYNVSFEDAARRTAQIAYDLSFNGAPVLYSWPSEGSETSYTIDGSNVEWTEPHLKEFLIDMAEQSGANTVNLIAHSMGNRALTRVFASLSDELGDTLGQVFKEVILTAPDIDAEVFQRDLAPRMVESGAHITMYASSNDAALGLSRKVHGYPRAGDTEFGMLIADGIETVDASNASTDFLGHSYFAESPDVITDIFDIIHQQVTAAKRRALELHEENGQSYWIFRDKPNDP